MLFTSLLLIARNELIYILLICKKPLYHKNILCLNASCWWLLAIENGPVLLKKDNGKHFSQYSVFFLCFIVLRLILLTGEGQEEGIFENL